jgi:hypothetical protein
VSIAVDGTSSTGLSGTLTTYQELRDRIYAMARQHGFRPDWVESTRSVRLLLLYDSNHVVVARTTVPVPDITMAKLDRLREDLAPVFGKEWME